MCYGHGYGEIIGQTNNYQPYETLCPQHIDYECPCSELVIVDDKKKISYKANTWKNPVAE